MSAPPDTAVSPNPAPARWVAHLDMDAFYASAELLRYPELRGLPVVIGGRGMFAPQALPEGGWQFARLRHYTGRGVVTTATYEARALGVHSAMGLMKAAQLAPDAFLLPADFDRYRTLSRAFKAAVAEIAPQIEDRGIDEIYIELSELPEVWAQTADDPHAGPRAVAARLQAAVRAATGLSCSVGVTPNKLLSKLASDLDKPGGLTVLSLPDVPVRLWPLPVGRLHGVGPRAQARLAEHGVQTIGALAQTPLDQLTEWFGPTHGAAMLAAAHGRDQRPVVMVREPKSMSRETTFERDLHVRHDRALLGERMDRLCLQVAADLDAKQQVGRTIGIKLRFADFSTVTRDVTLPQPTAEARLIRQAVGQCLKRVVFDQRLRLLGVRVSALRHRDAPVPAGTLPLFPDEG